MLVFLGLSQSKYDVAGEDIEPVPYWLKASVLTTVPTLLSNGAFLQNHWSHITVSFLITLTMAS